MATLHGGQLKGILPDMKGLKTVAIRTTGHDRMCFSVVLASSAAGEKLKLMVIFKRITPIREELPDGVVVHCNKKGWMNNEVMKLWTDRCFRGRAGGFFCRPSLLICDSMVSHRDEEILRYLRACGASAAIIPGGLTGKLQPLDISVNHPFNSFIRQEWEVWMCSERHSYTASGRQLRATYAEVCGWIVRAWARITTSTIQNGFGSAGLIDGNESVLSSDGDNSDDNRYENFGDVVGTIDNLLIRSDCEEGYDDFSGFSDSEENISDIP